MSKTIDTLVEDVYAALESGVDAPEELYKKYGELFAEMLKTRTGVREPRKGTLRMSNIGKPCDRQIYYSVNNPEDEEKIPPNTYLKFLYGDLIELLLLFLAEASGHEVTGTQDEQEIAGIKGHRDAVIDGTVVDVKSASSYSFRKFAEGNLQGNDSFGYIDQLQSYLYAAQDDPVVTDKDRAAFFVCDKTLGHLCLDIHPRKKFPYEKLYEIKKKMVSLPVPPARGFSPEPDGKSGNEKLGINCSYCGFKEKCHPGLKTYVYSNGPRFLTKVVKEPKVDQA